MAPFNEGSSSQNNESMERRREYPEPLDVAKKFREMAVILGLKETASQQEVLEEIKRITEDSESKSE